MSGERPRWRADVHARLAGEDLLILDTGSGVEILEDRLTASMAPLLNGQMTPPEIIAQAGGGADTLDAMHALSELVRRGLIAGAGAWTAAPDLAVVVAGDYLAPELEERNREALADGRAWMLVKPRAAVAWLGPVFRPGRTACWLCMAARLRAVREAWGLPGPAPSDGGGAVQPALAMAAALAARAILDPPKTAELTTFDTRTLRLQTHVIARQRHCAACGEPRARKPAGPILLESRRKTFVLDGGHRAAPPEETWAQYAHLISPLTGIVHSVEPVPGDPALNVFLARHNYRSGSEPVPRRSLGKGMTAAQSRTGALCEALERYSGIFRGHEAALCETFRSLGEAAVHPNDCLGISDRQYATREEWNRTMPAVTWIGAPFDEERPVHWVPAWSLTEGRTRYVAAAYCYYGHAEDFCRADSNGSAAGTCLEDAVLQGLLELVERDAVAIWWYNQLRRPALPLDAPHARAMVRHYAGQGRRLWVLDLTTDIGIPVYAALSTEENTDSLLAGFGAHLDPAMAATRALTELNQLLAARRARRIFVGALSRPEFIEPDGRSADPAWPDRTAEDLRDDVLTCVELLRARRLEVLIVDQTRDDVGLPVVKVIVPGLRHFRPRFAAGRLYDVPTHMGWLDRPLHEDELNPAHFVA